MDQFEIQVGTNKKDAFEGWFVKVDDEKTICFFLSFGAIQQRKRMLTVFCNLPIV
ncbi:hypothetical protein LQU94_00900 [Peptoniphilus sp. KCTC 25270]|uniref:hypothetical protein n=1 Tax=Peptoniphilus sp. KCTC 25270 TaxID=2897414 RepID=UPI001E48E607|nr:hypothetical protein [Peptoniphilus sp. KCTC 25270]MCD1146673.1 hypothetical protein [Peptoniphilus sp. KCTC 25270]